MNENEYLASVIERQLGAGFPLVLISITSMQGSTPRHDGTKMVVGTDGKAYGTIGGGLIEAAAIKEALKNLASGKSGIMSFELSGKDTNAPGMICGGKAEIFLDYMEPTSYNLAFVHNLNDAIRRGKDIFSLTKYQKIGESVDVIGHAVMYTDFVLSGGSPLTADDTDGLKPELHNVSTISLLSVGNEYIIVDRIRKMKTVYCFGAGHVAIPTAHLANLVGFRVVVVDDRPEFCNPERFPEAGQTIVVKDFDRAMDGLKIDQDSFIIIVTRGHQFDRTVLEQALKTSAGYIGMISSRRKRETIYGALMETGITKDRLDFVHSPIGIDIGGETPEEIAISIVAELVKVRSSQLV
jgi:xanthine dehydrogenase accessory factor